MSNKRAVETINLNIKNIAEQLKGGGFNMVDLRKLEQFFERALQITQNTIKKVQN